MNILAKEKVHNNYIFELGRRFPALIEVIPAEDKARIKPNAYHLISSRIDSRIQEVKDKVRV
jgi:PII-like signaling protein